MDNASPNLSTVSEVALPASSAIPPDAFRMRVADSWTTRGPGPQDGLLLSEADRNSLSRIGIPLRIPTAGVPIYHAGDKARDVFLLLEGIVRVTHLTADGRRQVIAFHWPGDLFGMQEQGLYIHDAQTITACLVARLSVRDLKATFLEHPALQSHVLIKILSDLRETQHNTVTRSLPDATIALATFLLACTQHHELFDASQDLLTLPMPRSDIADYIGAAVETISRAFRALEHEGLIQRITPKTIKVDLERIRSRCAATAPLSPPP